ncbi:MAG: LPS export ABC transporter periplasmic protein LptC, partial [Cyclobacteriaceae bacterium]|nr:LPS export ABC transporter periplasmic protein LptC [Cyclobacteriaceae bacterium]
LDQPNSFNSKEIKNYKTEKRPERFSGRFFLFAIMKILHFTFYLLFISSFFFNCSSKTDAVIEIQEYTGPIVETGYAITYYSDSALVKMKMEAPRQLVFRAGDREFPQGLFIEFFDKEGKPTSTLKADYCYYTKKENLYKATGNVVIRNIETGDKLDTEELFWSRKKEEVFTDKFVRIEKDGELHVGEGLEAKQDFSYWKILKSKGTLSLNE